MLSIGVVVEGRRFISVPEEYSDSINEPRRELLIYECRGWDGSMGGRVRPTKTSAVEEGKGGEGVLGAGWWRDWGPFAPWPLREVWAC